jgi:Lon protease-like protein
MTNPSSIPLFPLPNLVLFPDVDVPLHIFEARYRDMIGDIAERDAIIGMVLLRANWEPDYYAQPDVYQFGCAGHIERLVRLPDGRYNLVLHGLSEFRIKREWRQRTYREAEVEWCPVAPPALGLEGERLAALRHLLVQCAGEPAEAAWKNLVDERGLRGAALVNFLCFHLDLSPLEKQTLLEALSERASRLMDILAFKLAERKAGPDDGGGASTPLQ